MSVSRDDFLFSTVIGEGEFSRVTSAFHLKSQTWMAVKTVGIEAIAEDLHSYTMVSNEIKALVDVRGQPGIVNLHSSFCDEEQLYLAFELHTGGDLRHHLNNGAFTEKKAAFVVICMASALQHCHKHGILHRDVKPENIIFDGEGFPHLTDFGCSFKKDYVSQQEADTGDEVICHSTSGTPQYLAPEVYTHSHRHGVEADFWSLGVTVFEMVCSYLPFAKHCPRQAITFIDELYQQNIFLTSMSLNQPHGRVRARPTAKAKVVVPPQEDTLSSMCAAEEEGEFGLPPSAMMSTPPITPTNISVNLVSTSTKAASRKFEVPMTEPTRSDVVDSIVKHNRHLKKKMLNLETTARNDLKAAGVDSDLRGEFFQQQNTHLTRGGQLYNLFEVRKKVPAKMRPVFPSPYDFSDGELISDLCIDIIEGLLDVRLWHRLGAGENFNLLQNHPWFCSSSVGLGCWEQVLEKRLIPPTAPQNRLAATKVTDRICEAFLHIDIELVDEIYGHLDGAEEKSYNRKGKHLKNEK
jgi:serine/threonine protein kinase